MTLEEALEYIYKVVKCREQDKAKCNGCESCSYNFKFGWTYKAEKAIAQYYEERHRQSEQTPAQPERKVGKWTEDNACEFCGFKPWYERDIHTLSYCPNCGADMRGEQYG